MSCHERARSRCRLVGAGRQLRREQSSELDTSRSLVAWKATDADVSEGGDFGYTMGSYSMNMEGPDGAPIRIDGKYLTLWRKQGDGSWKVTADMFNPNGPPTPVEE